MANEKIRVLLVDDEEDIVFFLKTRFMAHNLEIFTATDGEQAISQARKHLPDVIVLDVMMPPPDGYAVCRTLKDDVKTRHIPIIFLTAKCSSADSKKALKVGGESLLPKPFNPYDLLAMIQKVYEEHIANEKNSASISVPLK